MSSSAPKRRLDKRAATPVRRATSVSGRRVASRRAKRRLVPTPALAGAVAMLVAGVGAVFASASTDDPGFDASYQSIASIYDQSGTGSANGVDVSRSFDRELLEEQTQLQAAQREAALSQLVASTEARATEMQINQWVIPIAGYRLTSLYGEISPIRSGPHSGIDLAAPSGTAIVAVAGGTVTQTGFQGACGNTVMIRLDDGWQMMYCHFSSTVVGNGEQIQPGQLIGYVGSTGNSTGPHLHLEIWQPDGTRVNPIPKLAEHGVTL